MMDWGPALAALCSGTLLGFVFGLVPGLGGRIGLILSLPLAALFDPYAAAIFLFALHSVIHTSSSIPAIALGMPTSAADAATVLDGYPLAKMGRAGEALGASLSASAIGGVLGALAYLVAIPIARPLVASFGPPELLMLALLGITVVSSLSSGGIMQGFIVAALGAIFAMVGLDFRTSEARFTFGLIELWDGIALPAVVCGLFVIPEMLAMTRRPDDEHRRAISTTMRDVYRGMFATLRYKTVVLRSTLYGIMVGAAPAVGSTVGVWTAYGYAARTTKTDIPFGQGAIAGVIAPEAANNSKEGGAMIPTLLFAIPGSSGMAIMMAALAFCGVAVGPNMLNQDISLAYALGGTVILSNLLAIPAFFAVVPSIVRLSAIRREAIAPVAIAISVTAALVNSPTLTTTALILLAAAIGVALKLANWPRAPFILGFVIEQMAERAAFQTAAIWGWSALARPITLFLVIAAVGWLVYSLSRRSPLGMPGPRAANLGVAAALVAFFGAILLLAAGLSPQAGAAPLGIAATGFLFSAIVLIVALRAKEPGIAAEPLANVGVSGLFVASTPFVGVSAATLAFVTAALIRTGLRRRHAVASAAVLGAVQLALMVAVFDLPVEKELIGRLFWSLLGR